MYQMGIIFGAVFFAPTMGIHGLAWGVVLGALLYLLVLLPTLFKQKGFLYFYIRFLQSKYQKSIPAHGSALVGRGSGATLTFG